MHDGDSTKDDLSLNFIAWTIFLFSFPFFVFDVNFEIFPAVIHKFLAWIVAISFITGVVASTIKDITKEHGGLGKGLIHIFTETASSIWKLILFLIFIGGGVYIIISLFANPVMTIIWIFVALATFAFLFD